LNSVNPLFEIIRTLRSRNGCAWDREQTALSMWKCLAEEVYELRDAIAENDMANVSEELGDALFQLLFIIEIFSEKKAFSLEDVVAQVAAKMIRRHPHVYEDAVVSTKRELDDQWDAIKRREKPGNKTDQASVLDRVPNGMPSLLRALKVSKCVVKEGFDWNDTAEVLKTAREELDEFEAALASGSRDEAMMEFGDILFTLVNVARFAGFHPETALAASTSKFEGRYRLMEKKLKQKGKSLKALPRPVIDQLWEEAKSSYDR
jgi:MazG family protein